MMHECVTLYDSGPLTTENWNNNRDQWSNPWPKGNNNVILTDLPTTSQVCHIVTDNQVVLV